MRTTNQLRRARAVLAAAASATVLLAGCTHTSKANPAAEPTSSAPPATSSSAAPVPASTSRAGTKPSASISIPPNLCAATDSAQNTADAYMGALSAGDEKQALACVYGRTVPEAVTKSLLGQQRQTAVYLPKQGGADGPANFDYVGNGKAITVTVSRLADGKTWVTHVAVHQQ